MSESLPPAAGQSRQRKHRAEKEPQHPGGAKEGLAPGRTPSLPQAGGSSRAQAPPHPTAPGRPDRDRQKSLPSRDRVAVAILTCSDQPTAHRQRVWEKDIGEGRDSPGQPGHVTQSPCWLLGHLPRNPEHCSQTRQRKPIIFSSRWDEEAPTRFWDHSGLQLQTE